MLGQADASGETGQVFKARGDWHVHYAASSNAPISAGMPPGGAAIITILPFGGDLEAHDNAVGLRSGDGASDIGLFKGGWTVQHSGVPCVGSQDRLGAMNTGVVRLLPRQNRDTTIHMGSQENVQPRKKRGPPATGKGTPVQVRLQPERICLQRRLKARHRPAGTPRVIVPGSATGPHSLRWVNTNGEVI